MTGIPFNMCQMWALQRKLKGLGVLVVSSPTNRDSKTIGHVGAYENAGLVVKLDDTDAAGG
jgi:hypothetical protein